ncbi:GH3 family domain-containing protein [Roseospira visakhapatnamensis]|uniref:GH3 auxin-responsive promoter n=1 Tax=Roseospira visakhapatnamensis TaxID=390880 RepID=A0A7W6WAL2_9PROT|nr:GH3 auxin-responsive promoter family protein [Roseospira visakhapatnamensis]MBB4266616.1 hypothetical protein [Roseospira visakhapatnamensis]
MPIDATPALRAWSRRRVRQLAAQDPGAAQARTLRRLVHRARDTGFGRAHGFGDIRSVADFQARVPLRTWEDMWRDWWSHRFPRLTDVSWPGRVRWFAVTSGTTSGRTKHIPVTEAMMRANHMAALDVLAFHLDRRPTSRIWGGPSFLLGGSTDLSRLPGGAMSGDLSGIAAARVPWLLRGRVYPPPAIALLPDWPRKLERLTADLPGRDLRMIAGTTSWLLILAERLLDATGADSLGALFPNLELLIHGGVAFAPYRRRFEALLAGSHADVAEVYPASEGFIAAQDAAPEDGLRIMTDHGLFLEFVPVGELGQPQPTRHWLADAEIGQEYALVLSTCAGAWGHVLGDTVRLVSRRPPRLVVTGRTGWSLSVFGEHLIGAEVEAAVATAARAAALDPRDWTMGAALPGEGGAMAAHHHLIVEFAQAADAATLDTFRAAFDAALCRENEDYEAHRSEGLDAPHVTAVPPGRFAAWMAARGQAGGQHKVPRLIADPARFADILAALAGDA